jgi:hypothetical protein
MQASSGGRAENLGYFVPPSMIRHVLTDSEDGEYDGFPDLGFRTQTLDSPSAKKAYGLSDEQNGVIVIKVFDDAPAQGVLQKNDVILQIDDFNIAEDGSIRLSQDVLTDYRHAINLHHVGDSVDITYVRQGEVRTTSLDAREALDSYSLVTGEQFDKIPEYYIYGGILFVPLNMNLIKRWGNDWSRTAPVSLLQARNEWSSPQRRQLVVALQVMAADVNLGYHDWRNWIVEVVNGEPVRDFAHFSNLIKNNEIDNVVMENKNGYQLVINHEQALESEADILTRYQITAGYSANLFED